MVVCPHCAKGLEISRHMYDAFFVSGGTACSVCGKQFDLWRAAMDGLAHPANPYLLVGAHVTEFTTELRILQPKPVRLTDYGIDADARILERTLSTFSPLGTDGLNLVVELLQPSKDKRPMEGGLLLAAVPVGEHPPDSVGVSVMLVWIEASSLGPSRENLLLAMRALHFDRLDEAIVPSNTAVEASLGPLFELYFAANASRANVQAFLTDSGYGHQLNVVLPTVAITHHLPKIPDHIRGALNRLRGLRNDLVHRGSTRHGLESGDVRELVCAAAFGMEYFRFLTEGLSAQHVLMAT
jgi:hypothetical protein